MKKLKIKASNNGFIRRLVHFYKWHQKLATEKNQIRIWFLRDD